MHAAVGKFLFGEHDDADPAATGRESAIIAALRRRLAAGSGQATASHHCPAQSGTQGFGKDLSRSSQGGCRKLVVSVIATDHQQRKYPRLKGCIGQTRSK
jgi:hypothetical protein